MPVDRDTRDWDERYRTNDLPWDSGTLEPELVRVLTALGSSRPRHAIDIGCGTGTNVVYLAQQGIDAVGVDLAPTAIQMATEKARAAGVSKVRFLIADILAGFPVPVGSIDFAFDRGCFHCVPEESRALFAQRVHEMLAPGGYWLNLSGNADEIRPEGVQGPPQLRASEILAAVEPLFELQHLLPMRFNPIDGGPAPLGWSCLLRRRG